MKYFFYIIYLFILFIFLCSCQKNDVLYRHNDGLRDYAAGNLLYHQASYVEALDFYKRAKDCFASSGDTLNLLWVDVSIADIFTELAEWSIADSLYNCVLSKPFTDDSIKARALLGLAHLKIEQPEVDPEGSIKCFNKAINEHHAKPDNNDFYLHGYAHALLGNPQYGLELINQSQITDTSTLASAYYNKYRVYTLLNYPDSAQQYYMYYSVALTENNALSTIQQQQKYYDARALLLKQKREISYRNFTIVFLLVMGIVGVLSWQNKKKKEEIARKAGDLLSLAEELKKASFELEAQRGLNSRMLSKKEDLLEKVQQRFTDLFQAQFKVLERLYIAFNTPDAVRQDAVFGEAAQILKIIREDNKKQHLFEEYLNGELDGIMHKFRYDFPDLKESDYKLFSYIITGFSARTIASLTGFTTGSVYTKKNVLKSQIVKSDSPNKNLYYRYL